jgi:hypothetical protein
VIHLPELQATTLARIKLGSLLVATIALIALSLTPDPNPRSSHPQVRPATGKCSRGLLRASARGTAFTTRPRRSFDLTDTRPAPSSTGGPLRTPGYWGRFLRDHGVGTC